MTEQTYYALKYPLHVAAARGELMDTKTILESKAHHVNVKDMEGWTALHWAAKRGQMSVVDHLLKSGADVHAKSTGTQFGKTALHLASGDGHMHVIQKLLDAGAEVTGSWTYNEAKNLVRAGYPLGEALIKFVTLGEVTAASVVLTWGWKIEKVTEAYNIAKNRNHPTLIALLGAILKDNSKEPREASKLLAEVMNKTTTTATIPTIQKSSSSSAIPTSTSVSTSSSAYSSLSFPAALTSKGKTGLVSSTSSAQTTITTPTREELYHDQLQGEHLHLAVRLRLERTMSYMIEELGVDIYATDANGKTSLQVAEALNKQTRNHQSVIRLLQEQGVVKEREQKEETRFQNILENLRKCQGDTTSSSPHFIREQKELRNRLVAVTEEDPLMSAVRSLEPLRDFLAVFCGAPPSEHAHSQIVPPYLGSLSFSAASTSASNLSLLGSSPSFLPQFLAPQRLLDFEAQENRFVLPFWHKKDELTPEQPLFKRITELLTSIRDLQSRCPTTEKGTETRAVLESIARQYRLYVSNLCSKPADQRKELMEIKPVARCTSIGTRFLKPDFVRALLLASSAPVLPVGSPVSAGSPHGSLATFSSPRSSSILPGTSGLKDLAIDPYQGSHSVFKFGNIHFKLNPHAPGMEYMVNSIGNLVAGQGTPPTELVRADVEANPSGRKSFVMLASKSVDGLNLHHVLSVRPDLLDKVDPKNFAAMFILSLLTDPYDGKPDNYVLKINLKKMEDEITTEKKPESSPSPSPSPTPSSSATSPSDSSPISDSDKGKEKDELPVLPSIPTPTPGPSVPQKTLAQQKEEEVKARIERETAEKDKRLEDKSKRGGAGSGIGSGIGRWRKIPLSSEEVASAEIYGIDNDISFADPVVKFHTGEFQGKSFVNVKCVLYFLSQMHKPLDKEFKSFFLELSPESTIIKWLSGCRKKNREYSEMVRQGVITIENAKELKLPIRFTQPLAISLYDKMRKLQALLSDEKNAEITPHEIFHRIEPEVANYYDTISAKFPDDPLKSIFKLYYRSAVTTLDKQKLKSLVSQRSNIQSQLAKTHATMYDYDNRRALLPEEAIEHFIYTIDFSKLPHFPQLEVLAFIMHLSILKRLSFNGLEVLDGPRLLEFANAAQFPNLHELVIINCPRVLCKDLLALMSERPSLELILGPCPHITKTEWHALARQSGKWSLLVFPPGKGVSSVALPISETKVTESLHRALFHMIYQLELLEFLIERGADMNLPHFSDTPLNGCSALQIAVKQGAVCVASLLLHKGANPNMQNPTTGDAGLHYAARRGHLSMIRVLYQKGGDPFLKDRAGRTVFGNAIRFRKTSVVCFLAGLIEEKKRRSAAPPLPPPELSTPSSSSDSSTSSSSSSSGISIIDSKPPPLSSSLESESADVPIRKVTFGTVQTASFPSKK